LLVMSMAVWAGGENSIAFGAVQFWLSGGMAEKMPGLEIPGLVPA
jgi:hypothetical protein